MDEQKISRPVRGARKYYSLRALILAVAAAVALTAGILFGAAWMMVGPEGLSLAEAMALINLRFVGTCDKAEVVDAAAEHMIAALGDRWSLYLNAESYAVQKQSRDNSYVGIGVTVSYEDERGLLVLSVSGDGPADAAGILPGEIIIAVDGVSVAGESRKEGADRIRGEKGTAVVLELLDEDGGRRTVEVIRDRVEENPVSYQLLNNGVGLIVLQNFFSRSAEELKKAVEDLIAQGAGALVFDVRDNPGGYLDELTEILDYLLPEGPIFRSRDRAGNEDVTMSDAQCVGLPIAVLVNGNSYSAAEFFAAQLRETAGAVVAGTRTSGKGYSQQIYPLLNGGAVSISTRAYLTGGGVSLIGTGLQPDPYVELSDEQSERLIRGKLKPEEDLQLQAAMETLF